VIVTVTHISALRELLAERTAELEQAAATRREAEHQHEALRVRLLNLQQGFDVAVSCYVQGVALSPAQAAELAPSVRELLES